MLKIKKIFFVAVTMSVVVLINTSCTNYANNMANIHSRDLAQTVQASTANLELIDIPNHITYDYENYEHYNRVISEFTTQFDKNSKARANNITLASLAMDQIIIEPNTEFSFNEAVGPTTKNKGFMLARIFVKGKDSKGYGGGVCQASSTLYNAVLDGGFLVTERHPHSKKVMYVEKDRDAATSYGGKDFKFVNNRNYPIKINSYVSDDKFTVAIERV